MVERCFLNAPVQRILVENGKAVGISLANGQRFFARAVISNVDLKHTFLDLVEPADLSSDFRSAIARIEPACSAFSVHLAIDFVPTTNPILDVQPSTGPAAQIVIPSLVDPSAAPPGFATIEITTLVPHAEARLWFRETPANSHGAEKQAVAYRVRKSDLGDKFVAVAETVIPDLRRHILFWRRSSARYLCSL